MKRGKTETKAIDDLEEVHEEVFWKYAQRSSVLDFLVRGLYNCSYENKKSENHNGTFCERWRLLKLPPRKCLLFI
jgi:hypothetical protein